MDKCCSTCRDRKSCALIDKIDLDIETEVQCKLEEGILDDILREELDLTEVFEYMQEEEIIKKNINIHKMKQEDDIKNLLIEQISDKIWRHIIRKVSDIQPEIEIMKSSDFCCSEWR